MSVPRLRRAAGAALCLAAALAPAPARSQGVSWPESQVLPRFGSYAALDVADLSGLPFDRKLSLTVLQGLVNRTKTRLYLLDAQQSGEGKNFWLDRISVPKAVSADPMTLFVKYKSEVAGLCVYDPALPGTIDVAVTAAGVTGCLAVSPSLAGTLGAAPYHYAVTLDLRNRGFADDRAAFAWAIKEYWPRCSRRMVAGMRPGVHYPLMDYVVANRAFCAWLAPEQPLDRPLLDTLFQGMRGNGVYVGWWAGETAGVGYASRYGVVTFATDWFANATVHSAGPATLAALPEVAAPPKPAIKCYIALILSDGDNLQIQEHMFPKRWSSPLRGTFPMSWTQSPALADIAPAMLNYYYATRTPNDGFITGPSGVGYVLPEHMEGGQLRDFARLTESYLKRTGLRAATVWGNTPAASDTFGVHCPSMLGMANHQHGEPLAPRGFKRWSGGMVSVDMTPDYASFAHQAISELDGKRRDWDRKAPLYLAAQLNANVAGIDELKKVYDHYQDSADVVFLRADQLFQLMRGSGTSALGPSPRGKSARGWTRTGAGAWIAPAGYPVDARGRLELRAAPVRLR